jgi:signal recognition particle GTPase
MIYFYFFLIAILFCIIFALVISYNKSKQNFQNKIDILEDLVVELSNKLITKNQSVKISEDFKQKIKESNYTIGNKVLDITLDMIEELYSTKSS